MTAETTLQQQIRLACCRGESRLFRNNVGALRDARTGRLVRFGLRPGSADLIGWRTVVIGPEHLGQQIAQFVSCEVKVPSKQPREDQRIWRDEVLAAGGLAFIAHGPDEAQSIIRQPFP
jgi:hypothetical protein